MSPLLDLGPFDSKCDSWGKRRILSCFAGGWLRRIGFRIHGGRKCCPHTIGPEGPETQSGAARYRDQPKRHEITLFLCAAPERCAMCYAPVLTRFGRVIRVFAVMRCSFRVCISAASIANAWPSDVLALSLELRYDPPFQ